MTTAALFAMLFVFMFLGMPIAIALGLSSLLTILFFAQDSLASLALKLYESSEHFTLLAIPYFILGGAFMTTGGVAKRMIRFAVAAVGHFPGGLAMASVLACMLFAAVSGSSPATVVAVGSIVIAGLVKDDIRQAVSGLPGLSKIPIFGTLFRSKDFVRNETEMVIIATPYLVRPVARSALQRPDDNFNATNDAASFFLGKVNKVYGRKEDAMPAGNYHGSIGFIYK